MLSLLVEATNYRYDQDQQIDSVVSLLVLIQELIRLGRLLLTPHGHPAQPTAFLQLVALLLTRLA